MPVREPEKTFRTRPGPTRARTGGTGPVKKPSAARLAARPVAPRTSRNSLPFVMLWLGLVALFGLLALLTLPQGEEPDSRIAEGVAGAAQPSPNSTARPTRGPANLVTLPPFASPPAGSNARPANVVAKLAPGQTALDATVRGVIEKYQGPLGKEAEFGLVIQNLDTGDRVTINNHKLFETASLYKLFVMLTVYYDISQGKMSLDDSITLIPAAAAADDDGGGLIVPVGGSLPVRDLLENMIISSNNTAALMLLFQVKVPHQKQVAADFGFKESDLSDSWNFRSTPEDISLYLAKLADQKLLGPKYDPAMLDLMSRTATRDRIPALLPPGTKVANKTGNVNDIVNDAGIVYLPNGQRLAIVVMVHQANPQAARTFISQLSLAAYNLYTGRS